MVKYTKAGFKARPIGSMFAGDPSNIKIATEGTQVGVKSVSKATEFMKNIPIIRDLPPLVQQQLLIGGVTSAGTYVYEKFLKEEPPKDEGETMEEYLCKREKKMLVLQMRNYFDSYFTFDKNYSAMDDTQKNAEVARYNKNQGGLMRQNYQTGGISMSNTMAQNRAINNAQRSTNQQQLGQGRNMQRATQLLNQAGGSSGSIGSLTDLYNKYFYGKGNLGGSAFQGNTAGKTSYTSKDRPQIIKDIAYQIGQQGSQADPFKTADDAFRKANPNYYVQGTGIPRGPNGGYIIDGVEYSSEQEAIDAMGMDRYTQVMSKGGRVGQNMGGLMRLNYMVGGEAKQMEAGAPPIMYSGNMDPNAQAGLPSAPGPIQMAEDGPEFDMREEWWISTIR